MVPNGKMRPLDVPRDLDGLGELIGVSFPGELARRGADLQEELHTLRRLIPVVRTLGRVSEEFRHLLDGVVWEDDGRIVGSVVIQRTGNDSARWYVGAVAVHPDYRRRGIARRLLTQAIEHARRHGARVCILDVREDNAPAYNLYRSLGFVQFDGTSQFKLEDLRVPEGPKLPPSYRLRPWKLKEWRASYQLALAETPPEVQAFLPVREVDHRITPLQRAALPLLSWLQGIATHRYLVEHGGRPVAALRLSAQRRDKGVHELRMWFDPAYRGELAEPLLVQALRILAKYPKRNLLVTVRTQFQDLVQLLEHYGFVEIERMHKLVLRLDG
ncbi:hypothetical protein DRJ54_03055 [Candidatus Acetothermia bacterium]|nr:MAG: hypothetical protein DRJ54_03055 [Candidatus Acetothermia bacterium]